MCQNKNNIIKNIILHTPSKVGVLLKKTFSHTPDEARSVGLVKACVLSKNLFCYREISFCIMHENVTNCSAGRSTSRHVKDKLNVPDVTVCERSGKGESLQCP